MENPRELRLLKKREYYRRTKEEQRSKSGDKKRTERLKRPITACFTIRCGMFTLTFD